MVGLHAGALQPGNRAVDQHHRHGGLRQVARHGLVVAGRGHDEAIHALLRQHIQVDLLAVGIVIGVAQQERIARCKAGVFHGAHQLREIRVGVVGHQHADGVRGVHLEAARDGAGHISQALHCVQHPLLRAGQYRSRLVEHMRHRGDRHPGNACDVLDAGHHRPIMRGAPHGAGARCQ
ncbi:hypothetical protein D3C71_1581630 [compost metagenome]